MYHNKRESESAEKNKKKEKKSFADPDEASLMNSGNKEIKKLKRIKVVQ